MAQNLDGDGLELTWEVARHQEIRWKILSPPEAEPWLEHDWLHELWNFRGRILFPSASPDRRSDRDPFDRLCHHLLARRGNAIIGCVRLSRILSREERREYFGSLEMEAYESRLPAFLERTAVCGRWVIDPDARAPEVAYRLVAGALVLGRTLGYHHFLSVAGTKLGQDRILMRSGAKPLEGFASVASNRFGQSVRILLHRPFQPPRNTEGILALMGSLLGIPSSEIEPREALQVA